MLITCGKLALEMHFGIHVSCAFAFCFDALAVLFHFIPDRFPQAPSAVSANRWLIVTYIAPLWRSVRHRPAMTFAAFSRPEETAQGDVRKPVRGEM